MRSITGARPGAGLPISSARPFAFLPRRLSRHSRKASVVLRRVERVYTKLVNHALGEAQLGVAHFDLRAIRRMAWEGS